MLKRAFLMTAALVLMGTLSTIPAGTAAPARPATPPAATVSTAVPMKKDGGVYVVPVSVNGQVTLDCIVDSGATDVNIPADVFAKLVRSGSVQKSDYLGTSEYTLADGSTERGRTFRIKSLKVGNVVVNNVVASVGGDGSSALLGQSFLERFASWSLDNTRHTLVLLGPPRAAPMPDRPAAHPTTARPAGPPDTTSVAQIPNGHATHGSDSPGGDSSDTSGDVAQQSQ